MRHRCFTVLVCALLTASNVRADDASDKVLDRFVGSWQADVTRIGPESPEARKLTVNEVTDKEMQKAKGRSIFYSNDRMAFS